MTLTVVGIHDFYENNLLMWLQEAHKIAQYQKIFSGGLTLPPNPPADWARFARLALFAPPKKNLK